MLDVWAVREIDCKVASVMAIDKVPVIPWYVAPITAVPTCVPDISPVFTDANALEDQVTKLFRFAVEPSV